MVGVSGGVLGSNGGKGSVLLFVLVEGEVVREGVWGGEAEDRRVTTDLCLHWRWMVECVIVILRVFVFANEGGLIEQCEVRYLHFSREST